MNVTSNIINTVLSVILAIEIVHLLFSWDDTLIFVERLGLGLWGAAVVLSVAGIWAHGYVTPYSVWYQWVWRVGGILYLSGRIRRLRGHRRRNQQMKDIAGAWLAGKST